MGFMNVDMLYIFFKQKIDYNEAHSQTPLLSNTPKEDLQSFFAILCWDKEDLFSISSPSGFSIST